MSDEPDALSLLRPVTPCTPEQRRRNVAHALSLGLPRLAPGMPRQVEELSILATGPSFTQAPRAAHPSMAVNGALGLMSVQGDAPTWWVGYDAQALVADFLAGPLPASTRYLVCSVCHPSVFEALEGRDVLLWHHSDDDKTQGFHDLIEWRPQLVRMPSVTLMAIQLGVALGHRQQQVWGWDGCYRGQQHHATLQSESRQIVTFEVEPGVVLPTTRTFLYEYRSARGLLASMPQLSLIVHGGGLFARGLAREGLLKHQSLARAA